MGKKGKSLLVDNIFSSMLIKYMLVNYRRFLLNIFKSNNSKNKVSKQNPHGVVVVF